MSFVKWTRPEIEVASTVDKRIHISRRITWRDVLSTVGGFEMDLRRAHASLRASDRRALNGKIHLHFRVSRTGKPEIINAESDAAVVDLEPYVIAAILKATFAESAAEMEVKISCIFDSDSGSDNRFSQAADPFEEQVEDPFADPYAAEVPKDDPNFGDPF